MELLCGRCRLSCLGFYHIGLGVSLKLGICNRYMQNRNELIPEAVAMRWGSNLAGWVLVALVVQLPLAVCSSGAAALPCSFLTVVSLCAARSLREPLQRQGQHSPARGRGRRERGAGGVAAAARGPAAPAQRARLHPCRLRLHPCRLRRARECCTAGQAAHRAAASSGGHRNAGVPVPAAA